MEPTAYGYRPGRTALGAVQEVHRALCAGHTEVIDGDVSQYFDAIPHADLMKSLARRISDRKLLRLLKMWFTQPAVCTDDAGLPTMGISTIPPWSGRSTGLGSGESFSSERWVRERR